MTNVTLTGFLTQLGDSVGDEGGSLLDRQVSPRSATTSGTLTPALNMANAGIQGDRPGAGEVGRRHTRPDAGGAT